MQCFLIKTSGKILKCYCDKNNITGNPNDTVCLCQGVEQTISELADVNNVDEALLPTR